MIFSTEARGRLALGGVLLLGLGLSACSSANPAGELVASSGFGPTLAPRPDFVERTRPRSLDYMTIGTSDPGRVTAARTPEEVKAAEAELDSDRERNFARGTAAAHLGGTPPPPAVVMPAAPEKPGKKKSAPKSP